MGGGGRGKSISSVMTICPTGGGGGGQDDSGDTASALFTEGGVTCKDTSVLLFASWVWVELLLASSSLAASRSSRFTTAFTNSPLKMSLARTFSSFPVTFKSTLCAASLSSFSL